MSELLHASPKRSAHMANRVNNASVKSPKGGEVGFGMNLGLAPQRKIKDYLVFTAPLQTLVRLFVNRTAKRGS